MRRAVLVADDDHFIRRLISTTLADGPEFDLREAGDGRQALALARAYSPSLIFLDVDMPGLDGIGTCERLRAEPATAQATIVMLTAERGAQTRRRAQEAGADLFLTKPFSPLDLLRLVEGLREPDPA